ncbi:hypothetical protein BJV82DRAFT_657254 [Fennellomyces sp. T-0311]|nr:hypothetical protein BJV82DRAFT_657254 [Fennellomyces sp. T-0311]
MAMYSNHYYQPSPQPSPVTHIKIVYVHGFLGSVKTFKDLPTKLRSSLHACYPNILVDNNIYIYKTRGRYKDAPRNLYNAVLTCIQTRWTYDPSPLIIFVGHSMGGLVAADTIRLIDKQNLPAFPNNARVIGLLAYDTPYFSIDHEFIKASFKTMTEAPLSAAIYLYETKRSNKKKSALRGLGRKLAVTVVERLNHGVSHLMNGPGEYITRTVIAAALLLAALAFYVFKELGHDSDHQESYPENYVVIPDYRDGPTLYANNEADCQLYASKVLDYLTFALENFRSDTELDARVLDLRNNTNIKFRCIYNIVPKLEYEGVGRPHTQFIRTRDNGFCSELFQPLAWPPDPFGRTRPKHFSGGGESVLAHIQMFGVPQGGPNEPNPTLDRLLYLSVHFLVYVIASHLDRQRNERCIHAYR